MKRPSLPISIGLALALSTAAAFAGCSDDEAASSPPDSGTDTSTSQPDTSTPDTGGPIPDAGVDGSAAILARGKYLVDTVGACGDCHTPRVNGVPDMTKYLSGADCFIDADPANANAGCLSSANLTNDATGLKNRTDADIKAMITQGKRPDGKNLAPVMPYYAFSLLKPADLDAIVAYLRTIPAIAKTVQPNQPPFDNVPAAAMPVDPNTLPPAGAGANENGRYLASIACLECHTSPLPPGSPRPIDMTKPFAGGREYRLGLPNPPFPTVIYSANVTQHPSGIQSYSVADITKVVKQGRDPMDGGVCPPMPAGPMKAFGSLTDSDMADIANYIKALPGLDNTVPNGCTAP